MIARLFVAGMMVVAILGFSFLPAEAGLHNCRPAWKCESAAPTVRPTALPTLAPTLAPTAVPTPVPTPVPTLTPTAVPTLAPTIYSFVDEFTSRDPRWIRHFTCCGTLAGHDPALAVVANGLLSIRAERRSTGWWSYLLDTKTTWTQRYGYFEARIKVPKGKGMWPAFWGYYNASGVEEEIDTMEVCANPIGTNGGNDASLLHHALHWTGGNVASHGYRTVDLSAGYHVYAHEWRSGFVRFLLDGVEVWRYTAHVPQVALPLILNLGVGGSWCSAPDASTPNGEMLVDWVRVRP